MPPRMSLTVPLSGLAKVRRPKVSLPMISALADDAKYAAPDPSPPDDRPRGAPLLRTLVRLARQAETAEQFGDLLRRKFERNARGNEQAATDDGALDRELDALERRLLGDAP